MAVASSGRWFSSIPTSGGWPILGHTVPFLRDTSALLEQQRGRHGDVFGLTVLWQPTVAFLTPEATRTIYLDRERVSDVESSTFDVILAGVQARHIGEGLAAGLEERGVEVHLVELQHLAP